MRRWDGVPGETGRGRFQSRGNPTLAPKVVRTKPHERDSERRFEDTSGETRGLGLGLSPAFAHRPRTGDLLRTALIAGTHNERIFALTMGGGQT